MIKKAIVNTFSRGMTSDAYEKLAGFWRTIAHFDNYTLENQLVPIRSNETGYSNQATDQIGSFVFANGGLYGLAYVGGNTGKLLYNTDFTVANAWSTASGSTVSAAYQGYPIDYHGALYISRSAQFDAYTYAATRLDTNISTLNVPFQCGTVRIKDDTLYLGSNNKVYASASAVGANPPTAALVLTLDADYAIKDMAEFGDYLALGLSSTVLNKKSYLYLYAPSQTTRDSDIAIEIGDETIAFVGNVNGELVIVSYKPTANAFSYTVSFRSYSSGTPQLFRRFTTTTAPLFGVQKQIRNNRLYFPMGITHNGNFLAGIWQVSRTEAGLPFEVTLSNLPTDTLTSNTYVPEGFLLVGDYMYQSYQNNGTYKMDKTDDQANYTLTSVAESVVNPGMSIADYDLSKTLQAVQLNCSRLSGSQQLVLKYRTDGGSWTTLFTKTATSPDTNLTNYITTTDASGSPGLGTGTQIEFRIESTGGAIPTSLAYLYEPLRNNILT